MDVQMLLAYNYKELKRAEEAELHFQLASRMCPNRFMPMYQLVLLYNETGRHEDAVSLARQIIDKDVKIPSSTVTAIKHEMQKLIDREEKILPDGKESRTGNVSFQIQPPDVFSDTPKMLWPP
jgi:tetratricopeptide (TPR) repeat protein